MSLQLTLTRDQLSKITTWMALNEHVTQVKIVEKMTSGIGPDHTVYFMDDKRRVWNEMDITDVATW